ncbi:hypothetical protein R0135_12480 [Congregibacter variabilis]|uniref:GGDEF domain-containing protein, diguanylate cyclase (C-di-GMP synthetase) or its enzymatically inactive variants n=1 Tax=Congregibacter variabilis TaxID=3081200 RepID=A0ABZ0I0S6_9GAMM|nr:hypothetical protein R0135_12480 [Congregibacter sp. IMCC43200]
MQRFKDLSLSLQLPIMAAGCALLVGLCLLWLAATSSAYLQNERERLYGESLAQQVSSTVREALQRGDLLSARASLQRFVDSSLAGGITIRDVEGMAMGTAGIISGPALTQYSAPIRIGEDIAGEVLVSVDGSSGQESRWRFLFSLLALAAALSLLVFMATRVFAQRLATSLLALDTQLALPGSVDPGLENEIAKIRQSVEVLPLDMLRGHAPVPAAATEFQHTTILFVHLASLARYVHTLGESNLHRYTRRLQQIVQAAAHCYRGELIVSRPFGLVISFGPQPNAGSEALRAASCARLIALISLGLQERTNLSLELAMALGQCEHSTDDSNDMYPELHLQGAIDELRDVCLNHGRYPAILLAETALADEQLISAATLAEDGEENTGVSELLQLSSEQENLLRHQAQMIVERIKPQATRDNA